MEVSYTNQDRKHLKILNPTFYEGLRLAPGAFRSLPGEDVYIEQMRSHQNLNQINET